MRLVITEPASWTVSSSRCAPFSLSRCRTSAPRTAGARARLLAGVIGAELGLVYVAVAVIQWNARFFNALEARDWDGFKRELFIFGFITLGAIVVDRLPILLRPDPASSAGGAG